MKLYKVLTQAAYGFKKYHGYHVGQLVREVTPEVTWYGHYKNSLEQEQVLPLSMLRRVPCNKQNLRKFAKDKRRLDL